VDWLAVVADITQQLPPDFEKQKQPARHLRRRWENAPERGDPWAQETMARSTCARWALVRGRPQPTCGYALVAGHWWTSWDRALLRGWQHLHCATAPIHDPRAARSWVPLDLSGPAELLAL